MQEPKKYNCIFALGLTTIQVNKDHRHQPGDFGAAYDMEVARSHANVPHVFGAIYKVDEHGVAYDHTPIDFDGLVVRKHPAPEWGKYKGKNMHMTGCDRMLLFPITQETAALLEEGMAEVAARAKRVQRLPELPEDAKKLHRKGEGPYAEKFPSDDWDCETDSPFYYTGRVLEPYAKRERFGKAPLRPDGTTLPVTEEEKQTYHRQRHARPKAGTNCRDFVQYMLESIGGVPINDIAAKDMPMPRGMDEGTITKLIDKLADESDIPNAKRKGGRLVDMGEGRYVYASKHGHGCISAGLNSMPKQRTADGREVPLRQFLIEESKPFYDPHLNEHNLGRGNVSVPGR